MSRGMFDLKDASGGVLYVFSGGKAVSEIPFTLDGAFNVSSRANEKIPELDTVFLSLPLQLLDFRVIEFPFSDPAKIRQAVPFELEGITLKGAGRVAFDIVLGPEEYAAGTAGAQKGAGPAVAGRKVLAVYAEKKLLRGIITSLKSLGAEPSVITSVELAGLALPGQADSFQKLVPALAAEAQAAGKEERKALALKEFEKPVINLRRGDLAYTKEQEEFSRSLKKTFMLAAVLVLVLSVKNGVMAMIYNSRARAVENEMALAYKKSFPGSRVSGGPASLYALRSDIASMQRKLSGIGGIPAMEDLKALTENKVNNVAYNDIHMDQSGITVKGEAKSLDDISTAKKALSKAFSVNVTETSNSASGVSFTMRLK
ncbi:MAG: hypothetical protein M0Z52_02210 [Actinomycetota bacterium]|nr:hypothetical protein [Actinomycetota bacterium]